jgi:hypothetical protein
LLLSESVFLQILEPPFLGPSLRPGAPSGTALGCAFGRAGHPSESAEHAVRQLCLHLEHVHAVDAAYSGPYPSLKKKMAPHRPVSEALTHAMCPLAVLDRRPHGGLRRLRRIGASCKYWAVSPIPLTCAPRRIWQ